MNQKTFTYVGEDLPELHVGDEVILLERCYEDIETSEWSFCSGKNGGVPGNMNREVRRYHGWRGTTNGTSLYAHGLRRVLKFAQTGADKYGFPIYKVTVGKDLHPDWE